MRPTSLVLALLLALAAALVPAASRADADQEHMAAALRYARLSDAHKVGEATAAQVATHLPPEKREAFLREVHALIDWDRIEKVGVLIVSQELTTEELNALADFYETPVGRSILAKAPRLMGRLIPAVQAEVMRQLSPVVKRYQQDL